MKKYLATLVLFVNFLAFGQSPLKFKSNGEFKILQFTDIHWSGDPKNTAKSEQTIRALIAKEKPDLIVLTGDNVNCDPMQKGWSEMGKILEDYKTPWTLVFGNHDGEHNLTNAQSFDFVKQFPHFIGDKGLVRGTGNFSLPIISQKTQKPAAYLYFLDSGDYTRNPKLGSYDWIHRDQVQWYSDESSRQAKANGKVLPSLMFFHIPLQEYNEVIKDSAAIGDKKEGVSSSEINSGMFAALLEQGNVMGVFCGHDHDNNFIGTTKGIALAYGNKTGNDGYGTLEHGGRVITLKENQFAFDSYISTLSATKYFYSFPAGISKIDAKTKILKVLTVSPKNPGLQYNYFEGNAEIVADIPKLKLIKTGTATEINLKPAAAEDHFALTFNGYIKIPETAFYKFYIYSDDGSVLKIDGETVVNNDGGHSAQRKEGIVALEKGFHKIEILYFEDYMGQVLDVGVSSIQMPEQPLNRMLFY